MALSFVWFRRQIPMQQIDDHVDNENVWHRSLLGLFLTVMLLIVGGFGLSLWELRHDQEMSTISVPARL